MKNIVIIGPPGSGKGTQSKLLSQKMGMIHICTGDLIRKEQANDTKIGKLATQLSDHGNYLPDNIVIGMVKQKVIDNSSAAGFIFDGFPRTVDQAKSLDVFLNARKTPINKIIIFDIEDSKVKERLIERAKDSGRADDNSEIVKVRLGAYKTQTLPVINYYKEGYLFAANRGIVILKADKTKEEVFAELVSAI